MVALQEKVHPKLYSDPMLTANIYCTDLTDRLIYSAIRPFWHDALPYRREMQLRMWLMRYRRCGQHLKVRLHGPESARFTMMELLQKRVGDFFDTIAETDRAIPVDYQIGAGDIPIDVEDHGDSNHPNCYLLWTTYRRSFVSLGSLPFLDDDHYVAHFTRCLAEGCEVALREFEPNRSGEFTNTARQLILLKALIEGLEAFGFAPAKSMDYLSYHRDWLIRFAIFKSKTDMGKAPEIIRHFDKRCQGMMPLVERLKPLVMDHLVSPTSDVDGHEQNAWQESLRALLEYVSPFCADENYRVDPYASDPAYPVPFKVFHGLANQLGLRFLDEAFGHHLLLSCLSSNV